MNKSLDEYNERYRKGSAGMIRLFKLNKETATFSHLLSTVAEETNEEIVARSIESKTVQVNDIVLVLVGDQEPEGFLYSITINKIEL